MSLSKFTGSTNNIQSLPDQPNVSASELKTKFDKTGAELKEYINDTLTEELDESLESKADSNNVYTKDEINGVILAEDRQLGPSSTSSSIGLTDNIKNYKIIDFILDDGTIKRVYNEEHSSSIDNIYIKHIGDFAGDEGYENIDFINIKISLLNAWVQYRSGLNDGISLFLSDDGNVVMRGRKPIIRFRKIIGYK